MNIDQIIAAAQVLATIGGAAGAIKVLRSRLDDHDRRLDRHDELLGVTTRGAGDRARKAAP